MSSQREPSANEVGGPSMTGPLRRVAMRRPGAILTADHRTWHYAEPIRPEALTSQFQRFVDLVAASGAEILWLPDGSPGQAGADDGLADSIFTYDPSFIVPGGAVVMSPGKQLRVPEAELHHRFYLDNNIPVLGRIEPPGLIEGGDCFWLDESTIAVGRGFRTNQAGIDQFAAIVQPLGIELAVYDLPYFHGPEACLHLLSVISPLDADLALIHAPLIPAALHQELTARGWTLLDAPGDEFDRSAGLNLNVLATGPRQLIAVDGFPETAAIMSDAGCTVELFQADALCLPCEGGPTCMTRPLLRS